MHVAIRVLVTFFLYLISSPTTTTFADPTPPALSSFLIETVNAHPNSTWTAGINSYFEDKSLDFVRKLCGVRSISSRQEENTLANSKDTIILRLNRLAAEHSVKSFLLDRNTDLPISFDARDQWSSICPTLSTIRDQSSCGSCWAFGAVEAISDRICIATNGTSQPYLSAADPLSCCSSCGNGCNGGELLPTWQYWVDQGIVEGGPYNSNGTCFPYPFPACEHHVNGSRSKCTDDDATPQCPLSCTNDASWSAVKWYGNSAYQLNGVNDIMQEIYENGPVEAAFSVYSDFPSYRSGVYSHQDGHGEFLGGHAIKLVGWGVDDNNIEYWVAVNSWNYDWGMQGIFWIAKGQDECGIEDQVVAGMPQIN